MVLDIHNTNDEVEVLKTWWKNYGTSVLFGVLLGGLVIAGVNYWRHYRIERGAQASSLYDTMVDAVAHKNQDAARAAGTKLTADFAATPYAGKAALMLARMNYDAADVDGARKQLQWAMEHATEAATQHAARLRLARILLDQGKPDEAAALANVKDRGGFESEYEELRGDVLTAKGQQADARRAYATALEKLPPESSYSRVLKMKLDNLGPADTGVPAGKPSAAPGTNK
jgi:predicted negative regulator of RcsB-dependent stress response